MKRLIISLSLLLTLLSNGAEEIAVTFPGDVDHLAFRTVERRQNAKLKMMLREGLSPHLRASDGTTLLMYAALHGDAEGVRILLQAGARPNATNNYGATALIWGAADLEKVRLLVSAGADVNARTKEGVTPLSAAISNTEGTDSVTYLLNAGADVSCMPPNPFGVNSSGIWVASKLGNLGTVQALLNHSAKVGYAEPHLKDALVMAIETGRTQIVRELLDWSGPGKLELSAADLNKALAASLLREYGPLQELFFSRGATVPDLLNSVYCDVERPELVSKLLGLGADVHAQGYRGYHALDYASLRGHRDVERLLLNAGAKPGRELKTRAIPRRGIRLTPENQTTVVSNAVSKSVDLLMKSSEVFLSSRGGTSCTSCHHGSLGLVAGSMVRSRGIPVREDTMERIYQRELGRRFVNLDHTYDRMPVLFPDTASHFSGYMLWSWSSLGVEPNPATKAMVWYLAGIQQPGGNWEDWSDRIPLTGGDHLATALVIRALRSYPLAGREEEFNQRIARARQWLQRTPAKTLTLEAFRLLGLAWADADGKVLREAADALAQKQKPDGGWSQLENMESDSWATGLSLLALHAAGLETTHARYRNAMEFLLSSQFDDGSWFVRSRSNPVQPPQDSHFPFGWDQWISYSGTALASAALALALEPVELKAVAPSFAEKPNPKQPEGSFPFDGARTVDFQKHIRPVFEESCVDCHSGDKPKGDFKVVDRASLLKGGASGMATFVPGRGADSQLIRHVTDQVEDMEMPPLKKRKTYPALTPEQVQKLITWIDEGAEWPEGVSLGSR